MREYVTWSVALRRTAFLFNVGGGFPVQDFIGAGFFQTSTFLLAGEEVYQSAQCGLRFGEHVVAADGNRSGQKSVLVRRRPFHQID